MTPERGRARSLTHERQKHRQTWSQGTVNHRRWENLHGSRFYPPLVSWLHLCAPSSQRLLVALSPGAGPRRERPHRGQRGRGAAVGSCGPCAHTQRIPPESPSPEARREDARVTCRPPKPRAQTQRGPHTPLGTACVGACVPGCDRPARPTRGATHANPPRSPYEPHGQGHVGFVPLPRPHSISLLWSPRLVPQQPGATCPRGSPKLASLSPGPSPSTRGASAAV